MTAVIHHGPPGSYKTFSIIQSVLIDALKQGRVVITNIRGFDNLSIIGTTLNISFPESAAIWYLEPNDEGFNNIARFFHWAPAGALIAMDEGQRIYPTRDKRFDTLDLANDIILLDQFDKPLMNIETNQPILRPRTVEIAFDQHRHYNWDIYISTPNISKIHKEIRHVVEWAYRHRNNSGLLPWLKNSWTEFRHDAETSGKSISHYSGSPKRYKADLRLFQCYQSTATGTAKASNENISILRDSRFRFLLGIIIVCLSYLVYSLHAAYQRIQTSHPESLQPVQTHPVQSHSQNASVSGDVINPVVNRPPNTQIVAPNDPLANAKIFYTGSFNNQPIFEIKPEGSKDFYIPLTYSDLRFLGYFVSYKSSSFVALQHNGKTIYAWQKPPATPNERGAPLERNGEAGVNVVQASSLLKPFTPN